MKIFVNARFLTQHMTGVQRYAVEICLELKRMMGDDIEFVSSCNIIQKKYAEMLNVRIIGRHKGHIWEQIDLPSYLRKNGNPLLLNLCNTAPLFYKNKIVTVHDVAFMPYPQTFSKSFLYFYRFMIPGIMRTARRVITVSEFSKDEIAHYYKIDRKIIEVVYSAVSDVFKHSNLQVRVDNPYFLAVSSVNHRKNFISVLEAFQVFKKLNKDGSLYIIGDVCNSNFKKIDIDKYRNDSRIVFLGRVSDEELVNYYSNALAFIFPSLYEGFGLPPLEAQMCGCPVLVADIPPLHEVIENSGIYCDPHDIHSIAEGMKKVIGERQGLQQKGFDNAMRFSFKNSACQIKKIIDQLNQ